MTQERHHSTEFDLWVIEQRVLLPDQVLNLMYLAFQAGQESPKQ